MASASMEVAHQMAMSDPARSWLWALVSLGVLWLAAVVMNLFFLRYLHVGRLFGRRPLLLWSSLALIIVMVFTPYFGLLMLLVSAVYLVSPLFTRRIDPAQAELEQPTLRTDAQA
jgi:hypothetical protein